MILSYPAEQEAMCKVLWNENAEESMILSYPAVLFTGRERKGRGMSIFYFTLWIVFIRYILAFVRAAEAAGKPACLLRKYVKTQFFRRM